MKYNKAHLRLWAFLLPGIFIQNIIVRNSLLFKHLDYIDNLINKGKKGNSK